MLEFGLIDRYLEQLRLLAANWTNFDISTRTAMRSAPFLLASQRVPVANQQSKKLLSALNSSAAVEEEYEREWVMCRATDVSFEACDASVVQSDAVGGGGRQHHYVAVLWQVYPRCAGGMCGRARE